MRLFAILLLAVSLAGIQKLAQKRTLALEQTESHHLVKDDTGMLTTVDLQEASPQRGTPSRCAMGQFRESTRSQSLSATYS
jgi:hypothetical protein